MNDEALRRARAAKRFAESKIAEIEYADHVNARFERAVGVPSEVYSSPGYLRYERKKNRDIERYETLAMLASLAIERLTGEDVLDRCELHGVDTDHCYPGIDGCSITVDEYIGVE